MEEPDFYQLRDPIPAEKFLPGPEMHWWIWGLLALAAILVIALLVAILRRSKQGPRVDPSAARRRALAALAGIDPSKRAAEVATEVSLLLRRFLADTLGDPALFETHEEFLSRQASLDGLPEDQRQQTRDHFATLAHLKYGPDTEADTTELLTETRQLLENLHPVPSEPSTHQPPPHLPHPASCLLPPDP